MGVNVKIMREGDILLPSYKTKGSAGCDLVNAGEEFILHAHSREFVHTGVSIALPEGYEAQVRGRSGLNKNYGIAVPVGTVDSDYRGEIGVVVYNLSDEDYKVMHNERIAQLIIAKVEQAEWEEVSELDETERGDGGFGHTGR